MKSEFGTFTKMSDSKRPPTANQLQQFFSKHGDLGEATTSSGNPITYKDATLTVGERGPIVLEDWEFLDEMSHFNRERIPERVVHAKGGGALGTFEVTNDLSQFTVAKVFQKKGKKTPVRVRFSTVAGNLGSADTQRDPRGFAVKFYTEDGIYDLVGNNTPIFFVRDPIMFPHFIHSQKRNPVTHLRDWDMFWDFFSLRPESMHQVLILFSDRGIPDGFRHMHGYGSHTFTLVNSEGKMTYCKFHFRTNQGIKNLDVDIATNLSGSDPDYAITDLYNAIAEGKYPSWTLFIQTMSEAQAASLPYNPFDVTKVWSQRTYPLKEVGKMELNQNPSNYFSEVEQAAFSPANFIPGIGPSPDRMLLGRLFSYHDAHIYRLGANYNQLAVNCPFRVSNFQRDGVFSTNNQGGAPNYHPNSFGGPNSSNRAKKYYHSAHVSGKVDKYDTRDDDNFTQPGVFYRDVLDAGAKTRLITNISTVLSNACTQIQDRNLGNFYKVDKDLGKRIEEQLKLHRVKANV